MNPIHEQPPTLSAAGLPHRGAAAAHRPAPEPVSDVANPTLLLKLEEAAAELRCTRRSLERQIAAHRICVLHIGRCVRIERTELEAFVARLRTEAHRATGTTTSLAVPSPVVPPPDPAPANDQGESHGQTT